MQTALGDRLPAARGSSPSFVKGWCPTVYEPMLAADGWLATLKPRVRGWTAAELHYLAATAERHGAVRFVLTNRGNLQVRGLARESAPHFAAAMRSAGLASADVAAERRRNLLMSGAQTPESEAIALELESWLESAPILSELPGKFRFAVSAECSPGIERAADISIQVRERGAWVAAGGGEAGTWTEEPTAAVRSLAGAFVALARSHLPRPRRFQELGSLVGWQAVFAAAGLAMERCTLAARAHAQRSVGVLSGMRFGLGVPFGRATALMLHAVAQLAERHGSGRIRLGAARAFILLDTAPQALPSLSRQARLQELIVDECDPRLRVCACEGGNGCSSTVTDVLALAATLAPLWQAEGVLHLSGCRKGCAYPQAAAVTLVPADSGGSFTLLRNSRADGVPAGTLSLVDLDKLLRTAGSGCAR